MLPDCVQPFFRFVIFFKIRLYNQKSTHLRHLVSFTQKTRYHFRMISGFSLLIHLLSVFRFHNNNPTIYKTDLHFIIHKLVAHRQTVARHQIMMIERPFRTLQTEIINLPSKENTERYGPMLLTFSAHRIYLLPRFYFSHPECRHLLRHHMPH